MGSIEVLPFGLLIFVVGSLLIANAWAVVDAKFATDAAAREAARTFVESTDPARAEREAIEAGESVLRGHGRRDGNVSALDDPALQRCALATFSATYEVPALTLPFIGGYGDGFVVMSTHTEIVDPYRSGLDGEATC